MIIKIIARGFIFGSNTYLHTGWNIMDGFLVIISIIDLNIIYQNSIEFPKELNTKSNIIGMFKVFRLLRTLRPLAGLKKLILLFSNDLFSSFICF